MIDLWMMHFNIEINAFRLFLLTFQSKASSSHNKFLYCQSQEELSGHIQMKGEVAVRVGWMLPVSHHDSLCWFHLGKQQRNWQSVPRYIHIYNCI